MSENTLEIAQQRICIEKVIDSDTREYYEMRNASSKQDFQKLKAAFLRKKLWPSEATIKIFFMESGNNVPRTPLYQIKNSRNKKGKLLKIDPLQTCCVTPIKGKRLSTIESVKKIVMERIQPIVGLKLEFTDNINDSNIRITFDPNGGAWSLLGTDCNYRDFKRKPTMNLGWLDVATTIHEFGHALGMVHEHQNPRGNQIEWNVPKVINWAKKTQGWDSETTIHNIINKYKVDEINGSEFDPESIMLYFFPGSLTINNNGTDQNLTLSKKDVEYLNKIYPNSSVDPSTFYMNTYDEESSKSNSFNFTYIVIAIIISLLLYFGYRKFNQSKEDKLISQTLEMGQQFGIN